MFMSATQVNSENRSRRTGSPFGFGRFMQADPVGYEAGTNLYGYVSGDPVNFTDPLGLTQVDCADPSNYQNQACEIVITGGGCTSGWTCIIPSDWSLSQTFDLYGPWDPGSRYGPTADLAEALFEQITTTARDVTCSALSALPRNGRIRLGADGGLGAGASFRAGFGWSIHRDGSINRDYYYGFEGGGIGAIVGAGIGIDNNARSPDWRTTRQDTNLAIGVGPGGFNVGGSPSKGASGGAGLGVGPDVGYLWTTSNTQTNTEQIQGAMCYNP